MSEIDWKERERGRFESGEYSPVPWALAPWFTDSDAGREHFAHVSTKDPSKLAYTADTKKGIADRQTPIKPGRYLNKYFADTLSADAIRSLSGEFAVENETIEFALADSPDEIETVYESGPSSCMDGSHGVADCCRVYHPEFAVAYMGAPDSATARAVVSVDRLLYSRVYGDATRLESALESAGYSRAGSGGFDGMGLTLIESGCGYVAPYWDNSERGSIDHSAGRIVLSNSGDITLNSQSGIICGESCEYCGDAIADEDEMNRVDDAIWCQSCYENNSIWCENCEESTHSDNGQAIGSANGTEYRCQNCASDNAICCSDCSEYWVADEAVSDEQYSYCPDCAEKYSHCERCETLAESAAEVKTDSKFEQYWCPDCIESDAIDCADCADTISTDSADSDISTLCPDCADSERETLAESAAERLAAWVSFRWARPIALLESGPIAIPLPATAGLSIEFAPRASRNAPEFDTPIRGYALVNPELILHATVESGASAGYAISHRASGLRASPILPTLASGFRWAQLVSGAPWGEISADGSTIPDEIRAIRRAADSTMGL